MAKVSGSQLSSSSPFHFHVSTLEFLYTHVPLLPSSVICYWPNGSDALQLEGSHRPGGK